MSAKTTTTSLSTRDVEFLDRLRELVSVRQSTMPATTKAPGRTADDQGMDATQREIRARWDFDGSILVGRVDTADGETYYIGTRAVATASEGTLVHAEEGDLARRLWQRTSKDRPGDAVMKRHLRVSYWTLVDARTDFDLRDSLDDPEPMPPPLRSVTPKAAAQPGHAAPRDRSSSTEDVDLGVLRLTRNAAAAAIRAAAEEIAAGRVVSLDLAEPLAEWNEALTAAGTAYGLDAADLTLIAVEAAADQRQREARRKELDHKIAVLDELVADGDIGRDDIEALQRKLVRMRDEADSLRQ